MLACAQCGEENPPEARLCWSCGTRLERLSGRREERRVVSVLFVDLVNFTGIAERLDPEDLDRVLTPYLDCVRTEMERFGGSVEKFIGDAAMAIFGAPTAHGDDAERAVRAALGIRDAIERLNADRPELDLKVRTGVATGEVFLDLEANQSRGERMASGDVIVTAFRLQQGAPVNGILVGEATHNATDRAIEYRRAEPVDAKGKQEPITAWEALAPRAADPPRGRLVGRDAELDHLHGLLEGGGTRFVTLVGPAGIGKSRLVLELEQRRPRRDDLWLRGRCLPYGSNPSYWALGNLVKAHAGILESDGVEAAEAKLAHAVDAVAADRAAGRWLQAYLRPLVGLGGTERLGGDRRAEAFSAWRTFLEGIAARTPTVLVLEDLHWADDGLLDFLDHLAEWAGDATLTVLVTARPELLDSRPGWRGVLRLEPLSTDDTAALVDELAGPRGLTAESREALLVRAGGNPLYAEELVRALGDRGPGEPALPETLQAIIAARLDGLQPEAKEVLQGAAVVGSAFWVDALASLTGLRHEQVERRLGELQAKEFVRPSPRSAVAGESQYAFWHVLVREVAYSQIPRARRAEKHRLAAEWIEALAPGRADLTELLAHHYTTSIRYARLSRQDTAPLEERARLVLRDAGDHASALYSYGAAAAYLRDALQLWPAADPERPQLLLRLGKALYWAERTGDDELREAHDALVSAGHREPAAEADVLRSRLALARGDQDGAAALARNAADLLAGSPPSREQAESVSNLAAMLAIRGESGRALEESGRALAIAEALGLDDIRAHSLTFRGHARIVGGDHGGLEDLEWAVEIAEGVSPPILIRSYANLATSLVELGDLERARDAYERGRAAAARIGDAPALHWLSLERPYELYWRGDWDAALAAAEAPLASPDPGYAEHSGKTVRAWIRLARGDTPGAVEDAAGALEFARRTKDTATLCQSLALHSRALLEAGRRAEAAAATDELLALCEESRPLASFWVADLADAAHDLDRPAATDTLARGTAATRWLVAARHLLAGEYAEAADEYAAIGALPEEAKARLRASTALAEAGRREEAEHELERSLAFYRRAGAGGYVRAGELLLSAG